MKKSIKNLHKKLGGSALMVEATKLAVPLSLLLVRECVKSDHMSDFKDLFDSVTSPVTKSVKKGSKLASNALRKTTKFASNSVKKTTKFASNSVKKGAKLAANSAKKMTGGNGSVGKPIQYFGGELDRYHPEGSKELETGNSAYGKINARSFGTYAKGDTSTAPNLAPFPGATQDQTGGKKLKRKGKKNNKL